jgi:ABC-type Zn2+ transport system substrate-binding protein/surface adhesin
LYWWNAYLNLFPQFSPKQMNTLTKQVYIDLVVGDRGGDEVKGGATNYSIVRGTI